MRFLGLAIVLVLVLAQTNNVHAQLRINGKVPGDLWRTKKVDGVLEVFHIWGRKATMPVKEAWINIDVDRITVGAKCQNPVLDGEPRYGYMMANMTGTLSHDFPKEIQTISNVTITQIGEHAEIYTTNTAMIVMKDGKPKSLIFTCLDYADFDIPEFVARLSASGDEIEKRSLEGLEDFDELGFRVRTFRAVFK